MSLKIKDGHLVESKSWIATTVLALLTALVFFLAGFYQGDLFDRRHRGLQDQIDRLHELVQEKMRPEIHVDRATIYNADGEIAIREITNGSVGDEGDEGSGDHEG